MQNNNKLVIIFSAIIIVALFQGCSSNDENVVDNLPLNDEDVTQSTDNACNSQYDEIMTRNFVSFDDCNFSVQTSEFEDKEVVKKQNNTILIFDVSGSMAGIVDGRRKIDIAKDAVMKFVKQIEGEDVNFGIMVYGHKGSNSASNKKISCEGIEELYFMGDVNTNVIQRKLDTLQPTGWTPIATSLKKAGEILSKYTGENNVNSIILVSDGKETCDGDPIAAAKELQNDDLNVIVNVIGFDVGGEDEQQLQTVANSGGGDYFSVKNAIDFDYAFDKHKALMEEFDYKIKNVSVQLADVSALSDKYFDCFMRLKEQEANVMLDIYAEDLVDEECKTYIETKYYQDVYNSIEQNLKNKFDTIMKEWHAANIVSK
jgi:Ca-activated chloride channel family protein